MQLFNFKKKEEKKASNCTCCRKRTSNETESAKTECRTDVKKGEIFSIKVLGAGCKSCREQFENAKEAVRTLGLSAEAEYITDMQKIMEYGVMSMPALVVNEKVVSMGKVLKAADIVALLRKLGF